MSTRSAHLIKLATQRGGEKYDSRKKNADGNIVTKAKPCAKTVFRESPIPESFEDQLIEMQDLFNDVFNDDDEILANEANDTGAVTTHPPSPLPPSPLPPSPLPPSLLPSLPLPPSPLSLSQLLPSPLPPPDMHNNIELANKDSLEDMVNYPSHSQIQKDNFTSDARTPMPSPSSLHECDIELCACFENEDPPIMTNDDLYGNLPTPSAVSITSFNTPTSVKSVQTRQSTFKTDKGKKRLIHKENWVVNKRKYAKNHGISFINARGKKIPAKEMKVPCNEKCRLKCSSKLDENQRNMIFKKFWDLGDRQRQWEFVTRFTKKILKRRQTTETSKIDRKNTFYYFLPDENAQKVKVCKTMFLNTISAGERIITTSWNKYDGEISVSEDKRGKYQHKNRIMDEEMIRSVCDHVKSFSLVESHYVRKNSKKLYLEGVHSASRMYGLYSEWFDSEKYNNKANKRQYRNILTANFNISFHKPKKDLCDICHTYKNKELPTEEEKLRYLKHQASKTAARHLKQMDKDEAKANEDVLAATFDFEKVLTTPHGDVSVLYYKRKLSTLNFTVYNLANKKATCFMWHEAIAKRGANEVSSCLYQYIKEHALRGVKVFKFWSDNCAGQNRNRIVFSLYLLAAKEFKVTITHRFMEKGHTQNEGDSVHSAIERASDRKMIFVPEEWYCLVRWAKAEGEPYEVKEMSTREILDFKSLLLNKNWNKDTNNVKIHWTRMKEVTVNAHHFDRIEYKYDFEDAPKTIVVLRSGNRNTARLSREFSIKQAYDGELSISRNKHKDLLSLCKSEIIPRKYHYFYENLKYHNGTEGISDEED